MPHVTRTMQLLPGFFDSNVPYNDHVPFQPSFAALPLILMKQPNSISAPRRFIFSCPSPRVVDSARQTSMSLFGSISNHWGSMISVQTLFVAPPRQTITQTRQPHGQSHGQAQSSSLQSQPIAASTLTTPPAPDTNTATPGAATVRINLLPSLARLVPLLCCASLPHTNGH
ncbi:hypothetical protein DFJ58DRAFT_823310 [Suillus subalutaceus]|uniref:uncharacterized protein n=1 Tax=Suillus subalutaceus TaxID=48586 RepID=UPI001B874341|nr:uncharacterized protein DFJ58DRAFT_823310 [Suillus subalutaceus]KAG1832306.1 hypothetical protein DFJ58DRAFT_823310 [Suillus subalutaceus]